MRHVLPWLSLRQVPGIGNLLFRRLLLHFGSPEAVFSATIDALVQVDGISARLAHRIHKYCTPGQSAHRQIHEAEQRGFTIITQSDPEYPALLLQIPDPPPVLYVLGNLGSPVCSLSVVGSRKATQYGLTATYALCKGLARNRITIISGMARGIDTAAHKAAISGGGKTIAVLGTGLDQVYPPENLKLYRKIAENGAVVSEFPISTKPEPHHFPLRNRIISGLSWGTVVVEAAKRSGSLITARLAAEQGRDVFAVPGNIHAATSQGTHALIKQGAKLVHDIDDILEELQTRLEPPEKIREPGQGQRPSEKFELSLEESKVLNGLEPYPIHLDELSRRLDMKVGTLTGLLIQLELKGLVNHDPGNFFSLSIEITKE
ncbi:MAG: DNA-protecting protein DprA [Desulfobacteraceae bacterium]|nr:DNA-protecting protein DprA [Desulfobacteraceae bacterium]